jgi:hypothetical protein
VFTRAAASSAGSPSSRHHLVKRHPVFGAEIETEAFIEFGDNPRQRLHLFRREDISALRTLGIERALGTLQPNATSARLLDAVRFHVDVLLHLARQLDAVGRQQSTQVSREHARSTSANVRTCARKA